MPLVADTATSAHCGSCHKCMDICPTKAIIAPYILDARRCISYLTIESSGAIPLELRKAIGNRIYGCDDCQLCCPWNKFAKLSSFTDFKPRHNLDKSSLLELFSWNEVQFKQRMQGSAIYRIGYRSWLRNIAVALGNAPRDTKVIQVLNARLNTNDDLVKEHIQWALLEQTHANK